MHPVYIILIIVFALLAVFVAFSLYAAKQLARTVTRPPKHSEEWIKQRQLTLEKVDFNFFDTFKSREFLLPVQDATLYCKVLYAKVPSKKWVVISHGYTSSHFESYKYAECYLALGYNCMTYDQRYFGDSQGDYCSMGYMERYDLVKVINSIYEQEGEVDVLTLHGESMGAATVLCALQLCKVDYVVADCGFADTSKFYRLMTKKRHLPVFPVYTFARLMVMQKYGFDPDSVVPIDAINGTSTPILFIHGSADNLIDCDNSIQMSKVCKGLSRVEIFEGAAHALSHSVDPQRYARVIAEFEKQALKSNGKEQFILNA